MQRLIRAELRRRKEVIYGMPRWRKQALESWDNEARQMPRPILQDEIEERSFAIVEPPLPENRI